jgi:triacylglycerol lipase
MSSRTHIVLVPGFGGFDALGQIFYYAGVTFVYEAWKEKLGGGLQASLHYFDNLPTAGVRTRAMALRAFLEERVFRDVFREGDRVALVGHSTGGLDIRQLLVNLDPAFEPPFRDETKEFLVPDERILSKIERLAFLSVPQRGTNIADFTRRFRAPLDLFFRTLEVDLLASRAKLLESFERWLLRNHFPPRGAPQVFDAVRDAILETLNGGDSSPEGRYQAALSRAAFGELFGWISNVKNDFFAIDDLACEGPPDALPTPARHPAFMFDLEIQRWRGRGVRTRSYATMAKPPFEREPRTDPYSLVALPVWLANARRDDAGSTDAVYRLAYSATAAGPFTASPSDRIRYHGELRQIESWENDGIVNTASMLWPDGDATTLVAGDHGDVIGHYEKARRIKASEAVTGREYHAYDILGSGMGFDKARFSEVWEDGFEFCIA